MSFEQGRMRLLALAGVVLAALAVLFAVVGRHDFEPLHSLRIVADVMQIETQTTGSSKAAPSVTRIEGWYRDGKMRWEVTYSGANAPTVPTVEITDGKATYYYDAVNDTYFEEQSVREPAVYFMGVGPAPAFSIEDTLRQARSSQDFVSVSSHDSRYLDRDVAVVTEKMEQEVNGRKIDLEMTYVIDPRYMVVLSYQGKSDYETAIYSATEVQYNAPISGDEFVFAPPASAKRIDPPVWSPANRARLAAGSADPPAGFFRPTYTRTGYRLNYRQLLSVEEGKASRFLLGYATNGVPLLAGFSISQTPSSREIPVDLRSDDVAQINSKRGYFTSLGGETRLSWLRDGVLISIEANQLSREQILDIARSMR